MKAEEWYKINGHKILDHSIDEINPNQGYVYSKELYNAMTEYAIYFAKIKCKEQRKIISEIDLKNIVDEDEETWIKNNLIINAPSPEFN